MNIYRTGCYLITPNSVKDLTYSRGEWCLPYESLTFPSLRVAKVYIKKNKGRLMIKYTIFLEGKLKVAQVQGSLTYD